jgi:aryl-alcohol dehydrogenase-like predicted oxidoreductase
MFDAQGDDSAFIHEILTTCAELIAQGKIRYIGLSNETPRGMMKFVELAKQYNLPHIVSNQNAYSLIRRDYEIGCAEVSMQTGVGLLAYSPLAGGLLSGKYQ